jgi:hypothetical protein
MLQEIRHKHTHESIPFTHATIVQGDTKRCLVLDGKHISKHHPYIVTYECETCHKAVQVGMSQFIHHIQKDTPSCRHCQWTKHGKIMQELHQDYYNQFTTELDHDEQHDYFASHLTEEEFERLRVGMHLPPELVYWPVWKSNDRMRYGSVLYDPDKDVVDKIGRVTCCCQECDAVFSLINIHSLKNKHKVLCKDCSTSRNTFAKRYLVNVRGDKVSVQSREEVKFVNWCNEHGVVVVNGPCLTYIWKGEECTYRVNFELPDVQWLVEVRKQSMQGGKGVAKEAVACSQGKRFVVVDAKNKMRILKELERKKI